MFGLVGWRNFLLLLRHGIRRTSIHICKWPQLSPVVLRLTDRQTDRQFDRYDVRGIFPSFGTSIFQKLGIISKYKIFTSFKYLHAHVFSFQKIVLNFEYFIAISYQVKVSRISRRIVNANITTLTDISTFYFGRPCKNIALSTFRKYYPPGDLNER